jgi:hypothetical protein
VPSTLPPEPDNLSYRKLTLAEGGGFLKHHPTGNGASPEIVPAGLHKLP